METRLPATANVATTASAARITPTQPKVPFAQIMGQTAVVGAEAAMNVLPGGPVMAAAIRSGGAAAQPLTAQTMSQPLAMGPTPTAQLAPSAAAASLQPTGTMAGASAAAEGPGAIAPAGGASASMNVDGALAQSQDMNLYYLRIQEQVNAENRSFTTMSNVMKAEHETVKTAIGNIR